MIQLTPVSSSRSGSVHATAVEHPIGRRVRTLCGRTLRVAASWTPGTYDRHARNAYANHDGGGCVPCARAAGLSHLLPVPRRGYLLGIS